MLKEVNIPDLIGKIYFKIATWHNAAGDYTPDELKNRLFAESKSIIELVLKEALDGELIETAEGEKPQEKKKGMSLDEIKENLKKVK